MNHSPLAGSARIGAGLALLSALLAPQAQATQLPPQNLAQLIARADVIVSGQVTAMKDGIQDGLPYTEITLKVSSSAKKSLELKSNYTIRQYGLLRARKLDDGRYLLPAKIEGMPSWQVGERVMAFMNKPAARSGFSTPVGLAQGKLTITGNKVSNGFNNVGLFEGMVVAPGLLRRNEARMLENRAGGVDLNTLQGLVQRSLKNNWLATGAMR